MGRKYKPDKVRKKDPVGKACVVLVTENNVDTISKTLDAISKNSYESLHIILGDNDSEDGTYEFLCEKLGVPKIDYQGKQALPPKFDTEWNGVTLTCLRIKKGTTAETLNICLGLAPEDSQFFVFMEPTDVISEDKIQRSIDVLNKYNFVSCVITDCFELHNQYTAVRIYNRSPKPEEILRLYPYDSNFVVPRRFMQKFDGQLKHRHDFDFLLSIGNKGIIYHLPEALYTRKPRKMQPEILQAEHQIKQKFGVGNVR